jgi:ADP-ribose pyrophosphatase YjhB (NUDIX family)
MFTIRVYGILLHNDHVLVSDEIIKGRHITKFPGGGLEYGEGVKDCLVREIREEMGLEALDLHHFYTTDFFQQSTFHSTPMQVISVYFTFSVAEPEAIPVVDEAFGVGGPLQDRELFRWLSLDEETDEALTLPIDRVVWNTLRNMAR